MSSLLDLPHPDEAAALDPAPGPASLRLHAIPDPQVPLDFEDVVRRLTPRLQRYATRRLGDRHEAEELVQEALLRAYDHRGELRTEDDVAAWSTCVTGRLVIDRLRVRGRSTSVAEVPEGSRVGRDTAEVVVARDEARLALDALDAMPPRQAAVLWAREVEGLAYDEIGSRFGMTEPAVRSVLSRARKSLRKEFATRGGTLPGGGLAALAPWLDGLGWLDRLRRVALRAAAPAAVGAASLGVVTGALVGPWDAAPAPDAVVRPAVVSAPASEAAVVPDPPAAAPVVAAAAVPEEPAPAARERRERTTTRLADAGLSRTCVTTPDGTAGAGGAHCSPTGRTVLHVGPPLPPNPTGIGRVGVETSKVGCEELPALPLTSCTTTEGEPR